MDIEADKNWPSSSCTELACCVYRHVVEATVHDNILLMYM